MPKQSMSVSPYDTVASSLLRFCVEVAAWVAAPWAAVESGWGWPAAIGLTLVLIAVPGVFSTPGDKKMVAVATPGPIRIAIELALAVVAVVASSVVLPAWGAVAVAALALAAIIANWRRFRWLFSGGGASQI